MLSFCVSWLRVAISLVFSHSESVIVTIISPSYTLPSGRLDRIGLVFGFVRIGPVLNIWLFSFVFLSHSCLVTATSLLFVFQLYVCFTCFHTRTCFLSSLLVNWDAFVVKKVQFATRIRDWSIASQSCQNTAWEELLHSSESSFKWPFSHFIECVIMYHVFYKDWHFIFLRAGNVNPPWRLEERVISISWSERIITQNNSHLDEVNHSLRIHTLIIIYCNTRMQFGNSYFGSYTESRLWYCP